MTHSAQNLLAFVVVCLPTQSTWQVLLPTAESNEVFLKHEVVV
jgi:hypothetical protein